MTLCQPAQPAMWRGGPAGRWGPALVAVSSLAVAACSHVTIIKTAPPGATVSIDGEVQGVTPLFYEEATGWGRTYQLRLELDGHQTEHIELQQSMWWHSCLWPSVCLMPFTLGVSGLGLLFARSLEDEYTFLLRPLPAPPAPTSAPAAPASTPAPPPTSIPAAAPAAARPMRSGQSTPEATC